VGPARQLPRAEGREEVATLRDGGLGRLARAGARAGEERREGKVQLGLGCVGRWLVAH
jgi:hypothetical protein